MTDEKQQSPNWQRYQDHIGTIEGFPFNESFPLGGPFGNADKSYELILRSGERVQAQVDYSAQYMTEGIRWETDEKKCIDKYVVGAWKEL
ncbi:hypothetical protein HZA99_06285 [Candidatus Woesearchaeota archaeon]|nr:hypothetical protein [Candidatus Woesearchaeota archaeon]